MHSRETKCTTEQRIYINGLIKHKEENKTENDKPDIILEKIFNNKKPSYYIKPQKRGNLVHKKKKRKQHNKNKPQTALGSFARLVS